jgi:hypothetical protein
VYIGVAFTLDQLVRLQLHFETYGWYDGFANVLEGAPAARSLDRSDSVLTSSLEAAGTASSHASRSMVRSMSARLPG